MHLLLLPSSRFWFRNSFLILLFFPVVIMADKLFELGPELDMRLLTWMMILLIVFTLILEFLIHRKQSAAGLQQKDQQQNNNNNCSHR